MSQVSTQAYSYVSYHTQWCKTYTSTTTTAARLSSTQAIPLVSKKYKYLRRWMSFKRWADVFLIRWLFKKKNYLLYDQTSKSSQSMSHIYIQSAFHSFILSSILFPFLFLFFFYYYYFSINLTCNILNLAYFFCIRLSFSEFGLVSRFVWVLMGFRYRKRGLIVKRRARADEFNNSQSSCVMIM